MNSKFIFKHHVVCTLRLESDDSRARKPLPLIFVSIFSTYIKHILTVCIDGVLVTESER